MKKLWILSPLVVIVLACCILYLFITPIFTKLISSSTGLPVSIEKVVLSPPDFIIREFIIPNLQGLKQPTALRIGTIDIDAPYTHYFKHVIEIHKIEIFDVDLTVEFFGRGSNQNNWSILMNSMNNGDSSENTSSDRYAVIEEFRIKNLRIRIIKDGKVTEREIPEIVLKNVQTKNGDLAKKLTQEILYQLIFNVQNIIDIPLNWAQDRLNNALPPGIPNLFGR